MTDELWRYYEQELEFFEQMAGQFSLKYPKIAARLQLNESKDSRDPHVERLIEAFALLTARIRRKADDEFPEVVESLLNMLYPRAVPSYSGRHQHLNVIDGLIARDPKAVKRAIRADLMEGGARLVELLDEIDAGKLP